MTPHFNYDNPSVNVSKIAYDLAMIYAKEKLSKALRDNEEIFENSEAPKEIEEMEYLYDAFISSYDYFIGAESGDIERCIKPMG